MASGDRPYPVKEAVPTAQNKDGSGPLSDIARSGRGLTGYVIKKKGPAESHSAGPFLLAAFVPAHEPLKGRGRLGS